MGLTSHRRAEKEKNSSLKPWAREPLGEHVHIKSGESPSLFQFTPDGYPYYKVEQLSNSEKYLLSESTPYHFKKGKTVPQGSVVFAKRGAAIALNKVQLIGQPSFMDTNLMSLTTLEALDCEFLFYELGYMGLWKFADTTSVPQINNKHVKPLLFPLPCLSEQREITKVLSDVDVLLCKFDELVAKKRNLRLATAQQLLTGRTRLPGFHAESGNEVTRRSRDFPQRQRASEDALNSDGADPCIHYGELSTRYGKSIRRNISRTDETRNSSSAKRAWMISMRLSRN